MKGVGYIITSLKSSTASCFHLANANEETKFSVATAVTTLISSKRLEYRLILTMTTTTTVISNITVI